MKNKFTKNKKAVKLLGEHIVNLVIAVLSIVVLILLGTAIYNLFLGESNELKQAKASLENFVDIADSLKAGETKEAIILNPKDWTIISWSSLNSAPAPCGDKSCICICKGDYSEVEFYTRCNNAKEAICQTINSKFVREVRILIENPPIGFKLSLDGEELKIEQK